jgi:hypothetical protein
VGDLPKLLTRAFAVGYLLPAVSMVAAVFGVLHLFGYTESLLKLLLPPDATLAVVTLVAVAFVAILLLALNRTLIRILEGYGPINPARLWHFYQRMQFRKLNEKMTSARQEWDDLVARKKPVDPAIPAAYGNALWRLASFYPDREDLVLPTKFGNILRAFEVYPRVVYGVESTIGWTRLHGAIPREYRELINDEKSQVDFWVNVWFTGCFSLILYAALAAYERSLPSPWIAAVALVVAYSATQGACQVAYGWGVMVISSFDLFREDLAAKLGLKLPRTIDKERDMWQTASQVWVFRSVKAAQKLDAYRAAAASPKKSRKGKE